MRLKPINVFWIVTLTGWYFATAAFFGQNESLDYDLCLERHKPQHCVTP